MIKKMCLKVIRPNSKNKIKCRLERGHGGKCNPYPFLEELKKTHRKIANKIIQDAYHSRGNKTKPFKNRSFRWDRPISQGEASKLKSKKNLGIPKKEYSSEEECFKVARKLTRLIYEMQNSPDCPKKIKKYLDKKPDKKKNPCGCPLCLEKLDILDFDKNVWGKAEIELWHIDPLKDSEINHNEDNLGWGHRTCNIAQQERNTDDTIKWMDKIVKKHKESGEKGEELVE